MIHIELRHPSGSQGFVSLALPAGGPVAVQEAIVAYRDSVWPAGISVVYSWTDEPGTGLPQDPPRGYQEFVAAGGGGILYGDPAYQGGQPAVSAEGLPWWAYLVGGYVLLRLLR